jgi:hypothetical protein
MKMFLALGLGVLLFSTAVRAQSYPQYYDISDCAKAEAEAAQRHLPLAWMGGFHSDLSVSNPDPGSEADLTQMALADLQGQAVVVFFEASNMAPVPGIVHAQDHIADDGPLAGGASWVAPKIVFTNPQVRHVFGRVSETQMKSDRESAINAVLQKIASNPAALQPDAPPPPAVTIVAPDGSATMESDASSSSTTSEPEQANAAGFDNEDLDISPEERTFWAWIRKNGVYAGFGAMAFLLFSMALSKPNPKK